MSSCGTGILGVTLHQSYLNTSAFYTSSHVFGSRNCLCAGPRGPSQCSAAFLCEEACLLMIPSPVWSLFSNACRFLSCRLALKVHVLRVHMHRRLINTLPLVFLLCLRGNYVIIPCVIMPVMPVHTRLYGASSGSPSKLEWKCWHPGRLLWLYHVWKRDVWKPDAPVWALFKLPLL